MKKILLVGKLNDVIKDIERLLSPFFKTQLCELKTESADGMLKVFEPDLVLLSLIGASDVDTGIFDRISFEYESIPVITIGTEKEQRLFFRFYGDGQFENLVRPVDNKDILTAICRRLNLELIIAGDSFIVKDPNVKKNVLIVDDDAVTLRGIRKMLCEEYDVSVATSGIQAMTAIGKQRPDLILLDYEMPVCDGRQTLKMIRADRELQDIPVIFLTGISDKPHVQAVLELKPAGYLLKPAVKEDLIKAIQKSI